MAPLNYILPKPLTPVFQKPLIHHIMDRHYAAGVRRFIVNNSPLDYLWDKAFPKESYRDCPVIISHEPSPLDSGGGIKKILPLIDIEQPLVVQNGDILTDIPIDELLAVHRRSGAKITLALRSVDGHKNVGFDPESQRVTDIRHALGVDAGGYQFAGISVIEPSIAELFPEDEELFSIVPIWIELVKQGLVAGHCFDWCNWYEIGSPSQYLQAILDTPSSQRIHPTASISALADVCEDSMVGEHATIMAGARLNNCIVWPRTRVEAGDYYGQIFTPRITVDVETKQ